MATADTWARVLDETDAATARLILGLQLQDLAALAPSQQAASNGTVPSDGEIARRMFVGDIADYCAIREIKIPPPIVTAPQATPTTPEATPPPDVPLSLEALREARIAAFVGTLAPSANALRERAAQDLSRRANVEAPGGRGEIDMIDPSQEPAPPSVLGKRKRTGDVSDNHGDSKRREHRTLLAPVNCRACGDRTSHAYTAPCKHNYCDECMQQMFTLAMKDETMFPPRCCRKPFQLAEAKLSLPEDLRLDFDRKQQELEDAHKVYCHVPTCSAYIDTSRRLAWDNLARCGECDASTCTLCKGPSHFGKCPEDKERKAVLEAGKAAGWQECKPCGRVVELTQGCYHMTCLCKAEFCYLCAAKWKTCRCPQWDEARLLQRATQIAQRGGGGGDVARVAAHLRVHHDCGRDGHDYEETDGEYDCMECDDTLRLFINECRHCHRQVCNWCMDRE